MWKVGASVITLLAALFYGIGRFLVDGFYGHLNTTAGAAGVGTISIIEPAAVLGAFVALFTTDVCDQAHAACIVLIARMIEALRFGNAETAIRRFHSSLYEQQFSLRGWVKIRDTQQLCDSRDENRPCKIEKLA